jgi:hypothetical protein
MTKLALKANPTFTTKVSIPRAGEPPVDVGMTFKHRRKTELIEFQNTLDKRTDPESFMEMVTAWDLEDPETSQPTPFNTNTVTEFLEEYIGAAWAVYDKYRTELIAAKLGN